MKVRTRTQTQRTLIRAEDDDQVEGKDKFIGMMLPQIRPLLLSPTSSLLLWTRILPELPLKSRVTVLQQLAPASIEGATTPESGSSGQAPGCDWEGRCWDATLDGWYGTELWQGGGGH